MLAARSRRAAAVCALCLVVAVESGFVGPAGEVEAAVPDPTATATPGPE